MPVNSTTRAYRWLYSTLTADATLASLIGTRVFRYQDIETLVAETYPIVVMQQMSSVDVRPAGKQFVMADKQMLVKCIDQSRTLTAAEQVMDRVTFLLDNQAGAVPTGGQVLFCQRLSELDMPPEVESGIYYQQLGAIFRLWIQ